MTPFPEEQNLARGTSQSHIDGSEELQSKDLHVISDIDYSGVSLIHLPLTQPCAVHFEGGLRECRFKFRHVSA